MQALPDGRWLLRAKMRDPKAPRAIELERIVEAPTAKEAAKLLIKAREERLAERQPRRDVRASLTVSVERWLALRGDSLRHSTKATYLQSLVQWCERLGERYLDSIEPHEVAEVLSSWRSAGLSPATCNGRLRVLRTLAKELKAGHIVEGVRAVPSGVLEDEEAEDEGRGLSLSELRAYLEHGPAAAGHSWPLLHTLALTGLRFSEASALEWRDIDLDGRLLRVRRGQVDGVLGHPKARASRRTTALPDELVAALRAHRARQVSGEAVRWVIDERREVVFPGERAHRRGASPYRSDSATGRSSVAVCDAAGFELAGRPRLHTLRHTFNNALRRVAPELIRQAMLGHADAEIGQTYSHATLLEIRDASSKVISLFRTGSDS